MHHRRNILVVYYIFQTIFAVPMKWFFIEIDWWSNGDNHIENHIIVLSSPGP